MSALVRMFAAHIQGDFDSRSFIILFSIVQTYK